MKQCGICGQLAEHFGQYAGDQVGHALLVAWREHDDHDKPIAGPDALVFLGRDHDECEAKLENHARLYTEDRGEPGSFPQLCGDCAYRQGLGCTDRDLKSNGGKGLAVKLEGHGIHVCSRGHGCSVTQGRARHCAGRSALKALDGGRALEAK